MGSGAAEEEKPTAAFVLSLLGGICGLFSGLTLLFMSSMLFTFPMGYVDYYSPIFLALGAWAVICSVVVLVGAIELNSNPVDHSKWGAIILVFSIIGGGSLLGCIGGIVALSWNPPTPTPEPRAPAPSGRRVFVPETGRRVCPQCGQMVEENVRFCPRCGWRLGD